MELFSTEETKLKNLLPHGGGVYYLGNILTTIEADTYFKLLLMEAAWEQDQVHIFGKTITTKRKVAWYGDVDFEYTYSQKTKKALPWNSTLLQLKKLVEDATNEQFNSCLLNLYHTGEEGMGWHSDDEKELNPHASIASLSLGANRKFVLKHKQSKEKVTVILENGSLLLMQADTQNHWLHSLPISKKVLQARINLTFRSMN